jgi:hypothetical protein
MKKLFFLFLFTAIAFHVIQAQNTGKIKLFYDCQSTWKCRNYYDFVRTEVKMGNFVNDRFVSDVHLMITEQSTGGGGSKFFFNFAGQKHFKNLNDTLEVITSQQATDEEIRKDFVKTINKGLFQFVLKTDMAQYLDVKYTAPDNDSTKKAVKDPYNFWVYSIGASTNLNGDANYLDNSLYGNISASRVLENSKFSFWLGANQNINKYFFKSSKSDKIDTISVTNHGIDMYTEITKGLNKHWSIGADIEASQSTFNNFKLNASVLPKVEYSIFPYKDFNSKRIVIGYAIGVQQNVYFDTTIYFKNSEFLGKQKAYVNTSFTQKWGNINIGLDWSSYLHDRNLYKVGVGGAVEWRIVKGLRLAFFGNYDRIYNQISLPKGSATRDEVITRQRQIQTNYTFWTGAGIRYQFGSRNNNAVNPRFNGLNYSISF